MPSLERAMLCVDDDELWCNVYEMTLKPELAQQGFKVTVTNSFQSGLNSIDQSPPDVLVTDYHLDDRTGTELIRYAREKREGIRTIIVTGGMAMRGVKEDIADTKPDTVVQKSVNFDQLIAAITKE